jgi:hypothetical protein
MQVFELVPSTAQAAEGPQGRAELGPDDFLDDVVTAGGGRGRSFPLTGRLVVVRAAIV